MGHRLAVTADRDALDGLPDGVPPHWNVLTGQALATGPAGPSWAVDTCDHGPIDCPTAPPRPPARPCPPPPRPHAEITRLHTDPPDERCHPETDTCYGEGFDTRAATTVDELLRGWVAGDRDAAADHAIADVVDTVFARDPVQGASAPAEYSLSGCETGPPPTCVAAAFDRVVFTLTDDGRRVVAADFSIDDHLPPDGGG